MRLRGDANRRESGGEWDGVRWDSRKDAKPQRGEWEQRPRFDMSWGEWEMGEPCMRLTAMRGERGLKGGEPAGA